MNLNNFNIGVCCNSLHWVMLCTAAPTETLGSVCLVYSAVTVSMGDAAAWMSAALNDKLPNAHSIKSVSILWHLPEKC